MTLKGQYVKDENNVTGMIEDEEPDNEGYISVYYGTFDKVPVRKHKPFDSLMGIRPPLNCRVNGEIPKEEFEETSVFNE